MSYSKAWLIGLQSHFLNFLIQAMNFTEGPQFCLCTHTKKTPICKSNVNYKKIM